MTDKERIRNFLAENFVLNASQFTLDDDASLLEAGIVDSTGILELTLFVEETFEIEVADDEIVPENFDTVSRIVAYVEGKTASATT
jgi:acyl carrier protein